MADSANAYAWGYIDHMVNAATDSSRYTKASNSVPFLGVVLHGYVQFAGTPMNMEGNVGHAMLKAIENGSGIYFLLSYSNTEKLKEDTILNKYYSVRYDIWFDELVERYTNANAVLKDLQTKLIIDHDFLIGERVPDADEIIADKELADRLEQEKAEAEAEAARIELINKIRNGRYESYEKIVALDSSISALLESIYSADGSYTAFKAAYKAVTDAGLDKEYVAKQQAFNEADAAYTAALSDPEATKEQLNDLKAKRDAANKELNTYKNDKLIVELRNAHAKLGSNINEFNSGLVTLKESMESVKFAYDYLTANADQHKDNIVSDITVKYAKAAEIFETLTTGIAKFETEYKSEFYETMIKLEPNQNYYKENAGTSGPATDEEEEKDEGYNYTKYTNDNGNIVAVTYGGKNGVDGDPYRTFILNYNYFSVTVEFEGVSYTIPAFGYVVIDR